MTDALTARGGAAFRTSFYGIMGIVILLFAFAGFASSYFMPIAAGSFSHPNPVIHLHAAMALLWLLIFITQAHLVANGNSALHRRIGMAGAVVGAAFVLTALPTIYYMITSGLASDDPFRRFNAEVVSIAAVSDLVFFVPLLAFAIMRRRRPEVHKRLMLLATCFFAGPGVFRLIFSIFGTVEPPIGPIVDIIIAGFFVAGPLHDRLTRGKIHKIYWLALPCVLLVLLRMLFAAESGLWAPVVRAIAAL